MKKDSKYSKKLIYIGGLLLMLLIALGAGMIKNNMGKLKATEGFLGKEITDLQQTNKEENSVNDTGDLASLFDQMFAAADKESYLPSDSIYFTDAAGEKVDRVDVVQDESVEFFLVNELDDPISIIHFPQGVTWDAEKNEQRMDSESSEIILDYSEEDRSLTIENPTVGEPVPIVFSVEHPTLFVLDVQAGEKTEANSHPEYNNLIVKAKATQTSNEDILSEHALSDGVVPQTEYVITKENFLEFFTMKGTQGDSGNIPRELTYDEKTGIVVLTEDVQWQSGNVTLNKKIAMDYPFSIKGEVFLGDKDQYNGGADGVGFGFHPGAVGTVGQNGNAMGIGRLPGAFGFALDTFYNRLDEDKRGANPDPRRFGGSNPDLEGSGDSFGSFIRLDAKEKKYVYEGSGLAAPEKIAHPDNKWHPIIFEYVVSGQNKQNKVMSITYTDTLKTHRWEANIDTWFKEQYLAFFILATTGGAKNLQEFKIDKMTYVSDGKPITARYVDAATGEEIPGVEEDEYKGVMGKVQKPVRNPEKNKKCEDLGYVYMKAEASGGGASLYNPADDSAIFSDQPLTVTYYYYKIGAPKVSKHVFNEAGTPVGVGEAGEKTVRIGDTIRYQIIGENNDNNSLIRLDSFYDKLPDGLDMVMENGKVKGTVTITQDGQPTESEFTKLNPIFNPTDENWEFLYDKDLIKINDKDRNDTVELNFYAKVTADAASKPKNVVTLETKIPEDGSAEADVEFQIVSDVVTKYVYEESLDDIIEIDGKKYTEEFTDVVGEKESVFNETWNQTLRKMGYVRKRVIVEPEDLRNLYDNSTDEATFPQTREPLVIKYVYGPRNNVKIHLRQVVDEPSQELVVPSEGYFHLGKTEANASAPPIQSMGTVTKSHTEHQPVRENDFTHLDLILFPGESVVLVQPIIPEYYDYVGYVATSEGDGHLAEHVSPTRHRILTKVPIKLDYETKDEYWVSVYIRPAFAENELGPRVYSWDYKKNLFGQLKLLP